LIKDIKRQISNKDPEEIGEVSIGKSRKSESGDEEQNSFSAMNPTSTDKQLDESHIQ
jgi:hypothetical protein